MAKVTKDFATMDDVAKAGYRPILINRVSTPEQVKGLPVQEAFMREHAKKMGFRKEPLVITVQESGKKGDRETLALLEEIVEAGNEEYIVMTRDVARFGRLLRYNLEIVEDLLEPNDIPLAPSAQNQNLVGALGNKSTRIGFILESMMAEMAKDDEEVARDIGLGASRERGLIGGAPIGLFPKNLKNGKSVYRRANEAEPSIQNGDLTLATLSRSLKVSEGGLKKIRRRLKDAREAGIIEEYLEVIDAIIEYENTRGIGARDRQPAVKRTHKAKALHRVTHAYLSFPANGWPNPLTKGNPQTATYEKAKATASATY